MVWFELLKIQIMKILILILCLTTFAVDACNPCYDAGLNENCQESEVGKDSYTLHMSVHPHLDAYWIFNFDSYYDPKPQQGQVRGYFDANRFTSVKQIFNTATNVLWKSKKFRETVSNKSQQAHRMFFNSQVGFFKHWFVQQSLETKNQVKEILKTKYWELLGGGFVEHDQGCAYYDDIIENFELGLHFLKEEFGYFPRTAISADSFGHSQSTLAILAHLGVEGYFVERSDQHILLQNKTEFIWRAVSTNGRVYGALPTHIRWAIHGFEDQFIGSNIQQKFCETKQMFIGNLRGENEFLKRILKSTHIMRYFGHDFQQFDEYSYKVIEAMMAKFSTQKCNKVIAVYGNPTEYFITLMGQVFGQKLKPIVTRSQDIFPIWDYDSGLYWTGYFTTDAYHKKNYRDMGRFLRGTRKFFLPLYISQPQSLKNKLFYQKLQQFAEQVSYLQHHDGISGTSKYIVMDELQMKNIQLYQWVNDNILRDIFDNQFPLGTNSPIFTCHLDVRCSIPSSAEGDIYLKILNTDGNVERDPIIIDLPQGKYYKPDCEYQINCFCIEKDCPCKLYLYKPLSTYTAVRLIQVSRQNVKVNLLKAFLNNQQYSYNQTHFLIQYLNNGYSIGYKKVVARSTDRTYDHLSRFGKQARRSFNIRPGKYALGNDPNSAQDFSKISQVFSLHSSHYTFFLINWKRFGMKTLISIPTKRKNQWKVETISATEGYHLQDIYFEVGTPIKNNKKFVTDSNGWLTVQRQMFKHEDYEAFFSEFDTLNGNSYPATAFAYIKDSSNKVSVNLQRPQGVVNFKQGTIWVNFDRLSQDDGKWVYESAYRSEYQKYTHIITVNNNDYNERKIQRRHDQPLLIQGNVVSPSARVEQTEISLEQRNKWNSISNIENLKFNIRPFNDSTVVLRLQNMNDELEINVGLFANQHSQLLTTFYGRTVSFSSVEELSLGANMKYSQFINSKWNWEKVVNLTQENKIFNKVLKENITLLPLQIRTFQFKGVNFDEKCINLNQLKYNNKEFNFQMNTNKAAPTRDPQTIKIQKQIINFMANGDHCNGLTPVLQQGNVQAQGTAQKGGDNKIFAARLSSNKVLIKTAGEKHQQKSQVKLKDVKEQQLIIAVAPPKQIFPTTTKEDTNLPSKELSIAQKITPQVQPQIYENASQIQILEQKISENQLLTLEQKRIYFTNKLFVIKSKGII